MDVKQKERKAILITGLFLGILILAFILNLGISLYFTNKIKKTIQEIKNLEKTKESLLHSKDIVKIYSNYLNLISKEFNQNALELIEELKNKEKRNFEEIKKIFNQNEKWEVKFFYPSENQLGIDLTISQDEIEKFRELYFQELLFLRVVKLNINSQDNSYKINLIIQ
ncbi:MAG: hypothetical protein QW367_03075 [Candidatus Aenigmatarchaeota archaeon]